MSREIPAEKFCLGTHPSMKLQREAKPNPSGVGNTHSTERFGNWFTEMLDVFGSDQLSVDTAALYQFVELFSAWCSKADFDPRQVAIWTKIGRYPAFQSPEDLNAEPAAIRSGDVGGIFDGTTDIFSLYDANATRALIMAQAAALNVIEFEGVAIHDPADHLMRDAGFIDVQAGVAFYEEERFDAEYDFANAPQWDLIESGTIDPLNLHKSTGQIKNVGMATKHAGTMVEFVNRFPGKFDYIMHTLCNPSATRGFCDLIDLAKQERDAGRTLKLDMGGILNGGLYATDRPLDPDLEKPRVERVIANYQNASDAQLKQAIAIQAVIDQHPGVTRRILAAEFAGQALVTYPDICNRCVLTSNTPSKTATLMEEVRNVVVPVDCWKQLIDEGLFDSRCTEFLL
jgi:hypothetical protein